MKQVTQERRQTCVAMVTLKPGKGRERERGSGVGDGWWWLWGGWVGVQRGRYRKHAVPMVTQTEGSWKRGSEAGTCSHTNITKETKDTWFHIHLILIMQHSEIWAAVPLCYQQKIWTNNKSFRHKKLSWTKLIFLVKWVGTVCVCNFWETLTCWCSIDECRWCSGRALFTLWFFLGSFSLFMVP